LFGKTAAVLLFVCGVAAQDLAREAAAARENDHLGEALALYRKGVAGNPKWTEGWWYLGTLLYDRDDYAGAAAAFKRAAALNTKSGQTLVMLGLCEAKLGKNTGALEHLRAGRKLGVPNDPQLRNVMLYTLGTLWLERGEDRGGFDYAQEALDSIAREGVDSEDLTEALGRAVLRIQVTGRDPELIRAAGTAEAMAAQRSKSDEAREKYQKLAANYPKVPGVQFAYGKFLLDNHYEDEAVAAFQRELENTPNHLLARLGIAGIKASNEPADALPYAEAAVKLAPDLPEAHYLLGLVVLNLGSDPDRAIAELETAQRGEPNVPKVYFALGRAYARANRAADAARARAAFARLDKQAESKNAN
jgi:tetratricopeptide (TPR) repeat protein